MSKNLVSRFQRTMGVDSHEVRGALSEDAGLFKRYQACLDR